MKPQEVYQAIAQLLSTKLLNLTATGKVLNLVTCLEIYNTIFDTLIEVLEASEIDAISNEAVNYLAQQLYSAVVVNGNQELDPDIFTQLAKVENIETTDLTLLAVILNGTDFAVPIIQEIKHRS
jgi:hypothetical protein